MLKMCEYEGRGKIKRAFYGGKGYMKLLLLASIGLAFTGIGLILAIPIWIWWYMQKGHLGSEYDECIQRDITFLKNRAVNNMGLVEEELSLIEPIVTHGYATNDSVKEVSLIEKEDNIIKRIFASILSLLTSEELPNLVFIDGNDKKVRSSLVNVTIICFTETQVVEYVCNYDICYGYILEEGIREIFYRDIDSVNYGDETLHVWSHNSKKYTKALAGRFELIVPSQKGVCAYIVDKANYLDEQIVAAKALIRSKKEEMD